MKKNFTCENHCSTRIQMEISNQYDIELEQIDVLH